MPVLRERASLQLETRMSLINLETHTSLINLTMTFRLGQSGQGMAKL